jgi:dUTP pyrophosphatase
MARFELIQEIFRINGEDSLLPTRASSYSAGYDFYMPYDLEIEAGETVIVFTDIKCYLEHNKVLMLFPRSSMASEKGLVLANVTGVIDADYYSNQDNDGNIGIPLKNISNKTIKLERFDRICQGVILTYDVCDNDHTNIERKGGFGSTGIK